MAPCSRGMTRTTAGMIEKSEALTAINDYLFGEGDAAISREDVLEVINLYLFG